MKGADIANQLRALLPIYTNDFTEQISVSSLARNTLTITATTGAVHGLTTNDNITIAGARESIAISSLTRVGNVVTATCAVNHKLPPPDKLKVPIFIVVENGSPSDYNGTHKLKATPSYKIFQYEITTTPASPATTPGNLSLSDFFLYNGTKTATVSSTTIFTYPILNSNLQTPAGGTIVLHKNARIDWAANFDIAFKDYAGNEARTKENWIYVVVNPREVFKNGTITTDPDAMQIANSEFRYETIQSFSIFTFVPASGSRLGGIASDQAREYLKPLLKSIGNFLLTSNLSECQYNPVTFQGDENEAFNGATYVHRFDFASIGEIRNEDVIDPFSVVPLEEADVAFDIDLDLTIDFGT